jgi:integrase/recombinase XerD
MLDNGADIRYIQAMLGHSKLETTEVYTRVSITKLQQVHERTHPANEAPGFRDQASGQATDSPGEPKSEIPKESLGESEPS